MVGESRSTALGFLLPIPFYSVYDVSIVTPQSGQFGAVRLFRCPLEKGIEVKVFFSQWISEMRFQFSFRAFLLFDFVPPQTAHLE